MSIATLPRIHKGKIITPSSLSDSERRKLGLATNETIVEVIGNGRSGSPLVQEALQYAIDHAYIVMDSETSGTNFKKDKIILLQLGDSERQYLIWYQTLSPLDKAGIRAMLEDETICKIGLNLKFDLLFLREDLDAIANNVADAMLVEQVLGCGLFGAGDDGDVGQTLKMTSMESQCRRWFGWDIDKDEETRTKWEKMVPGNWTTYADGTPVEPGKRYYAADDVCIPRMLLQKQKPWLKQLGLTKTINMEHHFLPVLVETEYWGLDIDEDKWKALADEAKTLSEEAQKKLDVLFEVEQEIRISEDGEEVEVTREVLFSSSQQLKDLIHDYMLKHHGVYVIITNEHFRKALLAGGRINQGRIDKMFEKKLVPNPKKPGKKMQVAYPSMSDVVEEYWEDYQEYVPSNAFVMPDTESKTLKLFNIIWNTPKEQRDSELPTQIGLPDELVHPIRDLRLYDKRYGTYGDNWFERLKEYGTGRVHASFIQAALATGRLSSTPNVQNLPADPRYRAAFIPRKGYKYVGGDWSQIEPRVIAHISGDPTYMRVFWSEEPGTEGFDYWCDASVKEALDLYVEIGKKVGIIPKHYTLKEVKGKDATEEGLKGRKQSKIIVLGLGYGTGIPKFWLTLMIDTGEHHPKDYAAQLFNGFWSSVPIMQDMLNKFSNLANPKKSFRKVHHPFVTDSMGFPEKLTYSESLGGRKRFFHPKAENWWTQGRNHPIQSTAGGDIMKHTAIMLARWMWKNKVDGFIVNLIHDELLLEVREDQAEMVKEAMSKYMRQVAEKYCTRVPCPASAYVDDCWIKD